MFGAFMSAMLLVYAVVAVVVVVAIPVVLIRRVRRELYGDAPVKAPPEGQLPAGTEDRQDLEEQRQITQVRLRVAAEAAVRRHDEVLEEWVVHLQDEQIDGAAEDARSSWSVDPLVQKKLLDAFDAAHDDRVDPEDPTLDHYAVGLYATRVRDVETAWTAYRNVAGGDPDPGED